MNFGEIKTYVRSLINRTDVTDQLASQFIEQTQIRIERILRTVAMENYVEFKIEEGEGVIVPPDLLEIIDVWCNDRELERVDMARFLKHPSTQGQPVVYIQTGHDLRVRPLPPTTTSMFMRYYAAQPRLNTNDDKNQWTLSASDALIYGAAELAGDYFEDERLMRYADKFKVAMSELEEQAYREDFSGPMSILPAYSYPED